jgi:hypothetical protein
MFSWRSMWRNYLISFTAGSYIENYPSISGNQTKFDFDCGSKRLIIERNFLKISRNQGRWTAVAEWMTERGSVVVTPGPYPYYGRGYWGPGWGGYSSSYFPAHFLRLTFAPDGKLKAWKQYSK